MARGGARKAPARTGPAGPGKYSRRTDGQQIATPGIGGPGEGGESSLQYGDVKKLESAQRIAPLPAGVPPPKPSARPSGQPIDRLARVPPHLLEMGPETGEPTTTGLDMGPGAGSEALDSRGSAADIREIELMRLWTWYGNKDAFDLLSKLREENAAPTVAAVPGASAPTPTEPGPEVTSEQPTVPLG